MVYCDCVNSNKANPAQIGDRQNGLDGRPCESCFSKSHVTLFITSVSGSPVLTVGSPTFIEEDTEEEDEEL